VKYMIMLTGSQQDYDLIAGKPTDKPTDQPAWSAEAVAAMHAFMASWNQGLVESGEFVDAHGLVAPVHTRRVHGFKNGVPVVTDGPYAETQEVLAGYTIVECESFDRATEIAASLTKCPHPGDASDMYVDVRPVVEDLSDLDS
jgi:hypothetical protein